MKNGKTEKIVVISPSGKEITLGFVSRCTDGFVMGIPKIGDESPPHLTVLKKDGKISSHITYQDFSAKPQRFPPMTTDELAAKVQELIDKNIVFQLTPEELPEKIIFLTRKWVEWFNIFMAALYRKEVSKKGLTHILDLRKALDLFPSFIEDLKQNPSDFVGLCQGKDFAGDSSKIFGFSESGLLIFQTDGQLIGMRLNDLLGANFMGIPTQFEGRGAFSDVYQSFGVPQYLQQEVFEKKYLENLFASETIDKGTLDKFKRLSES